MLRESQVQPLLLVFENLHWIDAETQAVLDSLIDSLPTVRRLLLVNYRPKAISLLERGLELCMSLARLWQQAVTRYLETLEQIVYADALGFDIAWLAELHFYWPFSILSSPLILAAALAQRRFAEEVMPAVRGL